MKKSISFVLGLSVVATLAVAAPAAAATTVVEGHVLAATGSARIAGCDAQARGEQAQGMFGWTMPVTAGASFAFESRAMDLASDEVLYREDLFELTFYPERPSCRTDISTNAEWSNFEGESFQGTVPLTATWAVVTLDARFIGRYDDCILCVAPCTIPKVWPLYQAVPCYFTAGPGYFTYSETTSGDPVIEEPPAAKSAHVSDLSMSFEHRGKPNHDVSTAATTVDEAGTAVTGAEVGFTITSPEGAAYSGTGTTDAAGVATFVAPQNGGGHGTWQACVTSVVLDGYTYDSGSNTETCDMIDVT